MAELTIGVLTKNPKRLNNFYNNIKINKAFTLTNGDIIEIDNNETILDSITTNNELDFEKFINFFMKNKRYQFVFKTIDKEYKLNDFMKTVDYGSSTGSSSGTNQTRLCESIHLHFIYLRIKLGRELTIEDITNFNINRDHNRIKTTLIIHQQDNSIFEKWIYSYLITANEFYNLINPKKQYIFYHSFYNRGITRIIQKKIKLFIKEEKDTIGYEPTINSAKWNPSDFYAISEELEKEIFKKIEESQSISDINSIISKYIKSKDLIPFSLKKIKKDDKIEIIDNSLHKPITKYTSTSTSMNALSSMSVYLIGESNSKFEESKKEMITFRSFSGNNESNTTGEINGKNSMNGKINLNYINYILSLVDIIPISTYSSYFYKNIPIDNLINDIKRMTHNIQEDHYTTTDVDTHNIKDIKNKLIVKHQSLKLSEILENNKSLIPNELRNKLSIDKNIIYISDFIYNEIFNYGYSISNRIFEVAPYYKIIIKN
jgi:hypothetical protein